MENETAPQREYDRQTSDRALTGHEDVLLDVPALLVESLDLEVADLRARVSLQAEVLSLLRLNVGVDADLGHAKLDLRGVDVQALLKVRLANVVSILDRVLRTIDAHPEIIEPLSRTIEEALRQTGQDAHPTPRPAGGEATGPAAVAGGDLREAVQQVRQTVAQAARQPAEGGPAEGGPAEGAGPGGEQEPDQPDIEARAEVSARDDRREEGRRDGCQGQGPHRYRSLLRRIRHRW